MTRIQLLNGIFFSGVVTARLDPTQQKYVINVVAQDNGEPPLISEENAQIRIDTFDPNRVIVTFHLDAMPNYFSKVTSLLNHIEESLLMHYPGSYVRKWCVQDKTT